MVPVKPTLLVTVQRVIGGIDIETISPGTVSYASRNNATISRSIASASATVRL